MSSNNKHRAALRIIASFLLIASVFMLTTGFSVYKNGFSASYDNTKNTVLVSNLVDSQSRNDLQTAFDKAGVSKKRQRVFWKHVDQFNNCIGKERLIDGYKQMSYTKSNFDSYELQNLWEAKNSDFIGYNCRLTAFGLMGNQISIKNTSKPDLRNIFMDLEAVSNDSSVFINKGEKTKFKALFSTIAGKNTKNQSKQINAVKAEWKKRGISVKKNSPLSLVTVYMHANYGKNDNEIFVGHTGVLIDLGSDGLFFVEKLAFQEPYRFIKLESRSQLKEYLLKRYKSYQGHDDAPAFVMENGVLMK